MASLDKLTMRETNTIDEFAGKISSIAAQSASLGEMIDETKVVNNFLKGLPRTKFIHIVASFEQVLNLKSMGFKDIVGRIKAYEDRIGERKALKEIYYTPNLKHNIINLGQATEGGCEAYIKGESLVLNDPSGRLLKALVVGMPQSLHKMSACDACLAEKQTRHSFPTKATYHATQALELIHIDLCRPISPPTMANNSISHRFLQPKRVVDHIEE
ncbi:unnamed protein product [Arabidopsis thaliana]|uniref:Similarity to retroelement pol polyprotein n=1 Tax=Arabidopsis thaliana TaxID=3702 RepID=Q9FHU8_ARATH|nr:unnamed protein product [Arabidopsis thaliana]